MKTSQSTSSSAAAGGEMKCKKATKKKNLNTSISSSKKKSVERSSTGLKKGPWTVEEDLLLSNYINTQGIGRWRTLPLRAGLQRCGKSCRLRWMNYLRPNVKRGQISPDEEDIILRLHRLLGNRWSLIAGRIPGRTDNEIKNYWNTHLSKKLISQGIDPRTHKPLPPPPDDDPLRTNKPPRESAANPSFVSQLNPSSDQISKPANVVCPNCQCAQSASVSDTDHHYSAVNETRHQLGFTNLMNDDHESTAAATTTTTTATQMVVNDDANDPDGEFILNHCNFGEDDDNLVFSSFFNSLINDVDISPPPFTDALLSPPDAYFLPPQRPEDQGTDGFINILSPSL